VIIRRNPRLGGLMGIAGLPEQASAFSFEFLQFPVVAQLFPNYHQPNDQHNDHGEVDREREAVRKQDYS
jgi:hypothetical protein